MPPYKNILDVLMIITELRLRKPSSYNNLGVGGVLYEEELVGENIKYLNPIHLHMLILS